MLKISKFLLTIDTRNTEIADPKKRKGKQLSIRKLVKRKRLAYGSNSERKKILDKALVQFIIRDLQPLSIVDDVGFTEFCQTLDSHYVLRSRKYVQESKFPTPQNEISSTSTVCATSSKQIKVTTTTSQVKLSAFYHPVNAHVHVKKEGVLRCIILMLTINGRPFSILEDLGFCTAFGTVLASVN